MSLVADLRAAAAISRRRARAWSGATLVFMLLVGLTTALAVALPRLYADALDDAIRQTVAGTPAVARDLQLTQTGSLAPGPADDPLREVRAAGDAVDATMPASVADLVADRSLVADSVEFVADDAPVTITHLKFRIQDGLDGRLRWVEGTPPGPAHGSTTLADRIGPDGAPMTVDVVDVGLSSAALETLMLGVGDELVLAPDDNDPIVDRYSGLGTGTAVVARIVGRFDVVDAEDPFWFEDRSLAEAVREPIAYELSIFHATAVLDPGAYGWLVGAEPSPTTPSFPLRYAWRRTVDPGRLDASTLPTLTDDVTRLLARYPFSGTNAVDAPPSLRWGMLALLERHDVQQRTASVTLALVALGPLGTALGALALVALLVVRRRAAADAVIRSRGASGSVMILAAILEAIVLVVPVAALGLLVGVAATMGRPLDGSLASTSVVALAAIVLLVGLAIPLARGPVRDPHDLARRAVVPRETRQRRLVLEGTILVVAGLAAAALRSRGAGDGLGPVAIDPLLAAVPVLVALAAGLVLLRLYPFPLRALAALAARGRGLLPAFPLWGASRHSRLVALPLLVILVATAMGAFSAAILHTVREGQASAAWRSVGADWRFDGDRQIGLPGALDPLAIDGIEAATGLVQTSGRLRTETVRRAPIRVDGVDPLGVAEVARDAPVPMSLPAPLGRTEWPANIGTEADPIPVTITPDTAVRAGVGPGGTIHLTVAGIEAVTRVVAVADPLPGSPTDEPSLTAPLGALAVAYPGVRWYPTSYLMRGGPDAADAILAAVAPYPNLIAVRSRDALFVTLRDAPVVVVVQTAVAVAIALAAVYAGLAILAGLTLAIATRRRDLQVLRTLGLSSRGLAGSIVIEQVPLVLVAVVGGAAVGVLIAWLLGPSVGLEAYADGGSALPIAIDPVSTILVGVLPTAVGVVAVIVATLLARRADLAGAVRFQDAP